MSDTVRIVRLTDRCAPDGTWRYGQIDQVSTAVARAAIAASLARLADGESLSDEEPYGFEVASLDGGSVPNAELRHRARPRERG
jgi:hypothetical protein